MGSTESLEAQVSSDIRGEVKTFTIGTAVIKILMTNPGMMRGGDFHSHPCHYFVLKGEIKLTERRNNLDYGSFYHEGQMFTILPEVPHIITSVTASEVLRISSRDLTSTCFELYRERVKAQFK